MKILLVGYSITRGRLGESFVELLFKKFPQHCFINHGLDGFTFSSILRKLINHLKIKDDYDCIIIQGGYNDILLTAFEHKGALFRFARKQQLNKGLTPMPIAELQSFLTESFNQIKQLYNGKLILLTLGCLNEKLESPLNQQRNGWNDILREVATSQNITLADSGWAFDQFLYGKTATDYCLESFWSTTIFDRIASHSPNGSTALSKKRKLLLTIDGVHLNKTGAKIFCNCVTNALNLTKNASIINQSQS